MGSQRVRFSPIFSYFYPLHVLLLLKFEVLMLFNFLLRTEIGMGSEKQFLRKKSVLDEIEPYIYYTPHTGLHLLYSYLGS